MRNWRDQSVSPQARLSLETVRQLPGGVRQTDVRGELTGNVDLLVFEVSLSNADV